MNDDRDLEINDDAWSEENPSVPKRRGIGSGKYRPLPILLGIVLVFVFVGGIIYFVSRRAPGGEANLMQLKLTALEQKIGELEKQLSDLQGKTASASDPALLQRVDALTQKMEVLEKQKQPAPPSPEAKTKPSSSPKPSASAEKKSHTVQKGETLYRVSKKYGVSVEELRKLNHLSPDQPLRSGQKLLIPPRP